CTTPCNTMRQARGTSLFSSAPPRDADTATFGVLENDCSSASIRREAVQQSCTANAYEIFLRAPRRRVRRVPRGTRDLEGVPVVMPDPRAAFVTARPVATRAVCPRRKRGAVEAGSGEDVMLREIRISVYPGCDGSAVLVHRMLEVDVRVVVVQILDVRGNDD